MKTKSLFKALPHEDQQKVIDLCNQHTYPEVAAILARPRPEGLQIEVSRSALSRFYCGHNEAARKAKILHQSAASLQITRQEGHGSFRGAILTLLETALFEGLRKGLPLAELKDHFALLKDFHKGFLAEEKWRHEPESKATNELSAHLSTNGYSNHYDFLPLDENGRPTDVAPLSHVEVVNLTLLDSEDGEITEADIAKLDAAIAGYGEESAFNRAIVQGLPRSVVKERIQAYRNSLRARGITAVQAAIEARRRALGLPPQPREQAGDPTSSHQKTLAIPHIPPNPG